MDKSSQQSTKSSDSKQSNSKKGKMSIQKEMISPMFSIVHNFSTKAAFKPIAIPKFDPSGVTVPFNLDLEFRKSSNGDFTHLLNLKNQSLCLEKISNKKYSESAGESNLFHDLQLKRVIYNPEEEEEDDLQEELFGSVMTGDFLRSEMFTTWNGDTWVTVNNRKYVLGWQAFHNPGSSGVLRQTERFRIDGGPVNVIPHNEVFMFEYPTKQAVVNFQRDELAIGSFRVKIINPRTYKTMLNVVTNFGLDLLTSISSIQRSELYNGVFYVFSGYFCVTRCYLAVKKDAETGLSSWVIENSPPINLGKAGDEFRPGMDSINSSDTFQIVELVSKKDHYLFTCGNKSVAQLWEINFQSGAKNLVYSNDISIEKFKFWSVHRVVNNKDAFVLFSRVRNRFYWSQFEPKKLEILLNSPEKIELEEGEQLSLFHAFKVFHAQHDKTKKYDLVKMMGREIAGLEDKWSVFIYKQIKKS